MADDVRHPARHRGGLVPAKIDGTLYSAFELYATAGLFAAYHVDPASILNDKGVALLPKVEQNCVTGLFDLAFVKSATLTKDGLPFTSSFGEEPLRSILADNRIGNRKPNAPVMITHSVSDDVIPYPVGKQLAKDWCAKGANVSFRPLLAPAHVGGILSTSALALPFFEARFGGLPQVSTCAVL